MEMFGPLALQEIESGDPGCPNVPRTACLLCDCEFELESCLPAFLKHVFDVHQLVIEDPQHIDNVQEYVAYWRNKFSLCNVEEILPAVAILSTDRKYFVLSTLVKEDKELRHKLKLERMLKTQETERNDENFARSCLFCRLSFVGKRGDFVRHLSDEHNLWLGNPQNLVYVEELLDVIERKLEALVCLCCEKTFHDRAVLKEHMRKKQHKRINPANRTYDKYYAVNYLDPDRKWHQIFVDKDSDKSVSCLGDCENSDREYEDWNEADVHIICLFCPLSSTDIDELCSHMNSRHRFNFYALTRHLDFYRRLKLVNYVRRQMHNRRCLYCDVRFETGVELDSHMEQEKHHRLPDVKVFDQPEFYFSTYENDSFLYFLEEIDD